MTAPYDNIRSLKRRLLEIAKEVSRDPHTWGPSEETRLRLALTECLRLTSDLARECETLAHFITNLQDKARAREVGLELDLVPEDTRGVPEVVKEPPTGPSRCPTPPTGIRFPTDR